MAASSSARQSLRVLQLIASVVAVATIASSTISESLYGYKIMIGGKTLTFAMLVAHTSLLYAFYQLVAVEKAQVVSAVSAKARTVWDLVISLVLAVAGIMLVTNNLVSQCDEFYQGAVRCGAIKAGVVFTFISAGLYFVSALLQSGGDSEAPTDAFVSTEELAHA